MSKEATTAFDRAFHTAMPLGWAEDAAPSNLMCMPVPAASRGPRIPPWTFSLFIPPPPPSARQTNESTVDTFSTLIALSLSLSLNNLACPRRAYPRACSASIYRRFSISLVVT